MQLQGQRIAVARKSTLLANIDKYANNDNDTSQHTLESSSVMLSHLDFVSYLTQSSIIALSSVSSGM